MAEDNINDILVRLDEIEKLQTELRHMVPRVNSSRHQNLPRNSSTSIRFPSLFTFPVVSNFSSTSSNCNKSEQVQKSAAQMNLRNRSSTTSPRNSERPSRRGSSTRESNIFKDLLKSTSNVAKSYGRNSLASTSSVVNSSRTSYLTRGVAANRLVKNSPGMIVGELKSGRSTTATIRESRKENHANSSE